MPHWFSSLRFRLLLLILLAVLPAVGLDVSMAIEQRRLLTDDLQSDAVRLTRIAAVEEEQLVNATRQLLITLAQLSEVRQAEEGACNTLLADLLQQYRRYVNLGVATPTGEVYCSALPLRQPANIADLSFFQRTLERQDFAIGDYQIGRISGAPSVNFGYPVRDDDGQVQAVVYVAMDLNWLNQAGAEIASQLPPDSVFTKTDSNGRILVRLPNPEQWVGQALPETLLKETLLAEGQGVIQTSGVDGIRRVYAFSSLQSPLYGGDEYVILGLSTNAVFGGVNQVLLRTLTGLGLVAILILMIAWLGSNLLILRPIQALIQTAQQLTTGNLQARTGFAPGNGELRQLAQVFDQMAAALEQQAEQQRQAHQELRTLTARLADAQETERKNLARELHDQVGQNLSLLGVTLNIIGMLSKEPADSPVRSRLEDASALVEQTTERIRDVMVELRPAVLDDYGLLAALRWYGREVSRQAGLMITVEGEELSPRLPPATETALFRIAQEALTNVMRHARAHEVTLTLQTHGDLARLVMVDDGQGFSTNQPGTSRTGWGLANMRERAEAVGGHLQVDTHPGTGTRISVDVPR